MANAQDPTAGDALVIPWQPHAMEIGLEALYDPTTGLGVESMRLAAEAQKLDKA